MDLYIQKLKRIKEIESQFTWVIKNDRKNWLKIAKLLHTVEQEELYLVKSNSFTQYVSKLAKDHHINISTLWRARSAANVFMEIANKRTIESIQSEEILTTPEQLELYGKVRTIAPEKIVSELKQKMLAGNSVRQELKSLWKTYKPLKRGKTERGRKTRVYQEYAISPAEASQFHVPFSLFDEDINMAIAQSEYPERVLDEKKRKKYLNTPNEILNTNIANALRSPAWFTYTLKQSFVARHQVFRNIIPGRKGGLDLHHQGNKLDVVGLVRPSAQSEEPSPLAPVIFGANIKTTTASLNFDETTVENSAYCHYYYIAVPMEEEMILEATKKVRRNIGIVAVDNEIEETKHKIKIIRPARLNKLNQNLERNIYLELLMTGLNW